MPARLVWRRSELTAPRFLFDATDLSTTDRAEASASGIATAVRA